MKFLLTILMVGASFTLVAAEKPFIDPLVVVKETTGKVLERVRSDKESLKEDPGKMFELVSEFIFPHFDFNVMSRFVLGSEWKALTTEVQLDFISQFRKLLVRTYASALLEFSDQKIAYPEKERKIGEKTAKITQRITGESGEPMLISYRLHRKDSGWAVFDVSVSGVSLVKTYRASFQSIVKSDGIDSLLSSLRSKNEKYGNL